MATRASSLAAADDIRAIGIAELKDALARGLDDFNAMPSHAAFLVAIYPVVGLMLVGVLSGYDNLQLVFPAIAGFALLGPFAALGMYELSRRREQGLETSWHDIVGILQSRLIGAILLLGIVLMLIFAAWIGVAQQLYEHYLGGEAPRSVLGFARQIFLTPEGWTLIAVGSGVGFLFALVVFSISVVSFPMLLDRQVGVTVAVATSLKAVLANPVTMMAWALVIAAALVIGSLPLLFGLAIVLPVLGHASWHLYRKLVPN